MRGEQNRNSRAVLWDMDGTLVDTAQYHWLAWEETMQAEGQPITYEQFLTTFGQRNDVVLHGYFGPDLPEAEVARIAHFKEARYRELVRSRGVTFLPGAREWLECLQAQGWRQALASSAPRANVDTILEVLEAGWLFDAIVAGEDVQRGKPDPQVFLLAAQAAGTPPERCVAVEDAPAGVEAARRAGMPVVGVLTSHESLSADLVVRSLAELPCDSFDRLLEGRGRRR
ncbi:MAG: HAD family hydrolase [Anaerolineae bacterium]